MLSNAEFFQKNKYVFVKNALEKNLVDFVTQYALFDEKQNPIKKDTQVPNAHSKYADPAMETILLLMQPIIEKNTGLELYPTYSYYRVYKNKDKLDIHTDRESCEISATVSFNFSYIEDKEYRWPIHIDNNSITMEPGDLAIYRGIELNHWREELIYHDDVWHVQAFLHYVDKNGPYSEFKYDKRSSIGEFKKYPSYIQEV